MKPLNKTFRLSKDHPAKECGLCAEQVHHSKTAARQIAKASIEEDINEDLSFDDNYWEDAERLAAELDSHEMIAVELTAKEFMENHWKLMGNIMGKLLAVVLIGLGIWTLALPAAEEPFINFIAEIFAVCCCVMGLGIAEEEYRSGPFMQYCHA